jgi:ubiquitin C-terminal hydrolase
MLSSILPSQECLVREKYVGIKNLGAICYINSILQQFFMIDKFRHMVLSRTVPKDIESVEFNGKIIVDDFMFQLQKLYHHLEYSQKKYIIPKEFCYTYKNFEGQPINTSIQ